jgi:uncharacterized membrane protein
MPSSRQIISEFIQRGHIQAKNINEALIHTQVSPSRQSWFKFIDRLLLSLGVLAVGFSVLFFIAYNWNEFGRFAKFALLEAFLAGAIIFYYFSAKNSWSRQISLMLASLFVGVLMAFFGQTYQTGADPWTLFFYWAILITPWVIIARFAPLWLSWLALLNVALSLYIDTFRSPLSLLFDYQQELFLAIFILNSCALIVLELTSKHFEYLSSRWIARLIASLSGLMITMSFFEDIISSHDTNILSALLWFAFICTLYVVYRHKRKDLFMLAGGCLSGIVIISTFTIQLIGNHLDEGLLLFIAFIIIGATSLSTIWLKKVHKEISL